MDEGKIDILSIHSMIKDNFEKERENIDMYNDKINMLEKLEETEDIKNKINKIRDKISGILNRESENYYFVETFELISEYKNILNEPIMMSFVQSNNRSMNNKQKRKIISQYLEIASQYTEDIEIFKNQNNTSNKIKCNNCSNKKDFIIKDDIIYICKICSSEQKIIKYNSSYKDISRISMSSKYTYDRKVHFRDCINQYQGKQNTTVPKKVYDELEDEFKKHYLLVDSGVKEIKFKNITKEHINMFIKLLGYTKHYENVNLIHYNITGIKPDDISYLQDKLLLDFDKITELYDKKFKNIDRKNFINTQYVLFQLLKRHNHKCEKEDFSILKTIDRKSFHDDICRELFAELGWNIIPYF